MHLTILWGEANCHKGFFILKISIRWYSRSPHAESATFVFPKTIAFRTLRRRTCGWSLEVASILHLIKIFVRCRQLPGFSTAQLLEDIEHNILLFYQTSLERFINSSSRTKCPPICQTTNIFKCILHNWIIWSFDSNFLGAQFKICQHWFRWWHGAEQATNHYLSHCWFDSLTYICGTCGRWVWFELGSRRNTLIDVSCALLPQK